MVKKGISLSRAIEFACISGGFFASAELAMRYEQNFAIGALLFFVCLVLLTIYTAAEVIKSRSEIRWLIAALQAVCVAAIFAAAFWWTAEPQITREGYIHVRGNLAYDNSSVVELKTSIEHDWYSLVLAGAAIGALLLVTFIDSATRGRRESKSGE